MRPAGGAGAAIVFTIIVAPILALETPFLAAEGVVCLVKDVHRKLHSGRGVEEHYATSEPGEVCTFYVVRGTEVPVGAWLLHRGGRTRVNEDPARGLLWFPPCRQR